jgi:hypothetical protein
MYGIQTSADPKTIKCGADDLHDSTTVAIETCGSSTRWTITLAGQILLMEFSKCTSSA